jgi:hypothetical protein
VQWVASEFGLAAFVRDQVCGAVILYGIRPTAHLAPRLSPVSAYGRQLLLDAATLSALPT